MACMFITTATLVYVFYLPRKLYLGPRKTRLSFLRERRETVYENLRDLNFEFKAGKFPDADYQSMKASLEEEAAAVLCGDMLTWKRPHSRAAGATKKEPEFEVSRQLSFFGHSRASSLPCAFAQTITGTVTNGTTNKPASGDDVVLLSLMNGMQEAGRTQTDAKGSFTSSSMLAGPHLIRVIHQE